MQDRKAKALVVAGTRPEIIKMLPVLEQLRRDTRFSPKLVVTGQHREFVSQFLKPFEITPAYDLDVMSENQSPETVASKVIERLAPIFKEDRPSIVLVQGDTTSAFAAAYTAAMYQITVGHVEAGLRTRDKDNPFPEEMNRQMIAACADLHFAPTTLAQDNLLREGRPSQSVFMTGNTVIDAMRLVLNNKSFREPKIPILADKEIVVTFHRRENHGEVEAMCDTLLRIVNSQPDAFISLILHHNPNVRKPIRQMLDDRHPRIQLVEPLFYTDFLKLLKRSYLIISDSGGIQEEAPAVQKPVLIARNTTERMEIVDAGLGILVGTDPEKIFRNTIRLCNDPDRYRLMQDPNSALFGDGTASKQIAEIIAGYLALPSYQRQPSMARETANMTY